MFLNTEWNCKEEAKKISKIKGNVERNIGCLFSLYFPLEMNSSFCVIQHIIVLEPSSVKVPIVLDTIVH